MPDQQPLGISIICVYNDPAVRAECLDRSIGAYRGALDVDYVPVDNTTHAFASAGAALNHGASRARYDLLVFVHQDVFLHSIDQLARVGDFVRSGEWAMIGANGVTRSGESVGLLRDRAQLLGRSAPSPIDVDSLDEVLFITERETIERYPLTEDETCAWHAYAVEYGMRMRSHGSRVGAVDTAISHNSLTINLAKLDVAHKAVGDAYPNDRPIQTTCGTIVAREPKWRQSAIVKRYGWRWRWLRLSLVGRKIRSLAPRAAIVLADIRRDIDLIAFSDADPLYLFDLDRSGSFIALAPDPLRLTRFGKPVVMRSLIDLSAVEIELSRLKKGSRFLVVGVHESELARLAQSQAVAGEDCVVGIQPGLLWLLGGVPLGQLPTEWSAPHAKPLGVSERNLLPTDDAHLGVGGSR